MPAGNWKWLRILPAALAAWASSANAYDPIVLERNWERITATQHDGCEAEVGSNGQFYVIAIYGLQAGEKARLHLANEDIKPIVRNINADATGAWSDYYLPFLWHHQSGRVNVDISSQSCDLTLSFDWKRQGVKVHG